MKVLNKCAVLMIIYSLGGLGLEQGTGTRTAGLTNGPHSRTGLVGHRTPPLPWRGT